MIAAYYGNSDWTDTPSPLLVHPDKVGGMPKAVVPTLESHIYVKATTEGRHLVANGARTEPDLPPKRPQELRRFQDSLVRVLDLSVPRVPVVS